MTTVQLLAALVVIGAMVYCFWPDSGPTAPGKHGTAMIRASQEAGIHGAGRIIEDRLGAAEARRFLASFTEGAAEPPSLPPPQPPPSPSPNA